GLAHRTRAGAAPRSGARVNLRGPSAGPASSVGARSNGRAAPERTDRDVEPVAQALTEDVHELIPFLLGHRDRARIDEVILVCREQVHRELRLVGGDARLR